ncbi:unnamed protein product [Plutella xylostella]|uniref:(diamondback moth) hypothetical protein n=1 Tax=Plutella xylostella TaxID=51655 RepID=A0A8S4ESR9_PLUXY|nr:unnamed protein product [Plutella xylostella]
MRSNDRYSSIDEMVSDFRLMFANCRQFNEEGSMVYEDANLLERALTERLRGEGKTPATSKNSAVKATKRSMGPHEQKLRSLYDAIRDFRDPKANRQLALIFMKLPSKTEYPDYYELIKNPIDMEKIAHKLKNQVYKSVNELASDFVLMFDNACKYNEPDSQIYKDALTLQRVCLQTKQTLRDDDDTVPDVPAAVQELLVSLFTTVYNHQDDEGRCFSDSMAELPEHDESMGGERVRAISLDLVKRRLDKGLYKRLDHFQTDMFAVFERARRLSRTDSQIFEDAVELQSYYIEQRDKLCAGTLQSPALSFTKELMTTSIELVKQCKLLQENTDEDETRSSTDESMPAGGTALQHAQYLKGDFVYLQPDKGKKESPIVQGDFVYLQPDKGKKESPIVQVCSAALFTLYRVLPPWVQHRRVDVPEGRLRVPAAGQGQEGVAYSAGCCLRGSSTDESMYLKGDFVYLQPEKGKKESPIVQVCSAALFTLYRVLPPWVQHRRVDVPEGRLRVPAAGQGQEGVAYSAGCCLRGSSTDESMYLKGDFVYLQPDKGKKESPIVQVERVWTNNEGVPMMYANVYFRPHETFHVRTRKFLPQEVFKTETHRTAPLDTVAGQCYVMNVKDYFKFKPEGYADKDVYVCESRYSTRYKTFKKIKLWEGAEKEATLVPRDLDKKIKLWEGAEKEATLVPRDLDKKIKLWEGAEKEATLVPRDLDKKIKLWEGAEKEATLVPRDLDKKIKLWEGAEKEATLVPRDLDKKIKLWEGAEKEATLVPRDLDKKIKLWEGAEKEATLVPRDLDKKIKLWEGAEKEATLVPRDLDKKIKLWEGAEKEATLVPRDLDKKIKLWEGAEKEATLVPRDLDKKIKLWEGAEKEATLVPRDLDKKIKLWEGAEKEATLVPRDLDKKIKLWEGAEKEATLVPRDLDKKIKLWEGAEKEATLVPRDVPLEPLRSVSVFRERVEKHRDELAELEVLEHVQEKERPDIQQYNPMGTDDENTYYEQYNTVCSGVVKTGDYVVVVTDGGKQLIAQVDTIWETGEVRSRVVKTGDYVVVVTDGGKQLIAQVDTIWKTGDQYNTVCSGVVKTGDYVVVTVKVVTASNSSRKSTLYGRPAIKTGDYVVVVTDGGKQLIAQVDTIWETGDNKGYFRGPFLIFPSEVANIINKPFYKQEVLLTTMHDTSPLVGIIGKCAVLDYEEYLKCRPTEIPESDVFVCESLYDESNRVARKLKSGLRKFEHSKDVTIDEIYYFPKRLGPPPLASAQEVQSVAYSGKSYNSNADMRLGPPPLASAQEVQSVAYSGKSYNSNADMDAKPQFTALINTTIGSQDVEMILENSLDESSLASPATPLSIGGNSNPYNPSMSATPSQDRFSATPTPASKKKKEQKQKIVTGYILYSSEVRKAIIANNPESTFGEISRIVGNEWRSLPASTKQSWEERAAKCNEETSAKLADEMRELTQHMEMTYECQWDTCDLQFEELSDCMEHCVGDCSSTATSSGHVQTHYRGSHTEYPCLWRNCARVRKGQAPFPNLARLVKHVRDLHINKSNGKPRAHHERARNFVPSSKKPQKQYTAVRSGVMSPGGSLSAMSPACRDTPSPSEAPSFAPRHAPPLFVTAPPRSQRLQHSDAYIRYIEGLHSDQKYITPWEKSLTPMPLNPDPAHFNMSKLPAHWMTEDAVNGYLAQDKSLSETDIQKMDQNTKVLKGLCALRDFMMRDAFNIHKHYNIST